MNSPLISYYRLQLGFFVPQVSKYLKINRKMELRRLTVICDEFPVVPARKNMTNGTAENRSKICLRKSTSVLPS